MPDAPERVWIDGILGLAYSAAVPGRHDLTEYLRADIATANAIMVQNAATAEITRLRKALDLAVSYAQVIAAYQRGHLSHAGEIEEMGDEIARRVFGDGE